MIRLVVKLALPLLLATIPLAAQNRKTPEDKDRKKDQVQQEEQLDYYKKWLKEDVVYIIADEEIEVFNALTTDDERDQFIEQFWFRRDPDRRTAENEYKEEHYRRIAYVNEKFGSGIPGWKTDRGRTYIAFGPPDIIEDYPSGGWYYRKSNEGGGATSVYPFQLWIYNFVDGLGTEVEVEFVDRSWSGEYRMALDPSEKDALLHVGGSGPTDLELEGVLNKTDRPYFSPGNARNTRMQNMMGVRAKDKLFSRLARFYRMQQPDRIDFNDLKEVVSTEIIYDTLPFDLGYEHLTVDDRTVLVPVTLEFMNRELSFKTDAELARGQVNIYGVVESLKGRVVSEFEDTLLLEFPSQDLEQRLQRRSVYQKVLVLEPGRYKLTLAVKDDVSSKLGTQRYGLILPELPTDELASSSIILARALQWVEMPADRPIPFELGDFKVIPNVPRKFSAGDDMGVYVQLYNAAIDQATLRPELDVEYQIWQGSKIVRSLIDPKQNSTIHYGELVVLLQAVDLSDLSPGDYILKVLVKDRVDRRELARQIDFSVVGS